MASVLKLAVELDLDVAPIGGRVFSGLHAARPFHGWLELTSVIEQLRSAAQDARTPTGEAHLASPFEIDGGLP